MSRHVKVDGGIVRSRVGSVVAVVVMVAAMLSRGTTGTSITGIDGTTLVGSYGDATGTHAFIASVPEPAATFGLLFAGATVTFTRRRHRQGRSGPPSRAGLSQQ